MIESAQIAITLLTGLGSSTACRAKSPVVSTVFETKMTLPDAPPAGGFKRSFSPPTADF
jgi:hypothetical protein